MAGKGKHAKSNKKGGVAATHDTKKSKDQKISNLQSLNTKLLQEIKSHREKEKKFQEEVSEAHAITAATILEKNNVEAAVLQLKEQIEKTRCHSETAIRSKDRQIEELARKLELTEGMHDEIVDGNLDLRKRLSELTTEFESFRSVFTKKRGEMEIKELWRLREDEEQRKKIESLCRENVSLASEKASLEEIKRLQSKEIESIKAQFAADNSKLSKENEDKRKEIESLHIESGVLASEKAGLEEEKRLQTKEIECMKLKVAEFEAKYGELLKENEEQKKEIESLQREKGFLASEKAFLGSSLEAVKGHQKKEIQSLQTEFAEKTSKLWKENEEERKEIESLCTKIAMLANEKARLEEIELLQIKDIKSLQTIGEKHSELLKENEKQREEIESMKAEVAEFEAKYGEMWKENEEHKKEIESLRREKGFLASEKTFLAWSLEAVKGHQKKEIQSLQAEFAGKNSKLWKENEEGRKEIESLCTNIVLLANEKASLLLQIKEMESVKIVKEKHNELLKENEKQREEIESLCRENALLGSEKATLEAVKALEIKDIESAQGELVAKNRELLKEKEEQRKIIESLSRENASLSGEKTRVEETKTVQSKEIQSMHTGYEAKYNQLLKKYEEQGRELLCRTNANPGNQNVCLARIPQDGNQMSKDKAMKNKGNLDKHLEAVSILLELCDKISNEAVVDQSIFNDIGKGFNCLE